MAEETQYIDLLRAYLLDKKPVSEIARDQGLTRGQVNYRMSTAFRSLIRDHRDPVTHNICKPGCVEMHPTATAKIARRWATAQFFENGQGPWWTGPRYRYGRLKAECTEHEWIAKLNECGKWGWEVVWLSRQEISKHRAEKLGIKYHSLHPPFEWHAVFKREKIESHQ